MKGWCVKRTVNLNIHLTSTDCNGRCFFFDFLKNHLTFFKSPRVISKKNKFFCESTVQRYSETCN